MITEKEIKKIIRIAEKHGVKGLTEAGLIGKINALDNEGANAMMYAIMEGKAKAVKALLEAKADLKVGADKNPLGMAIMMGSLEIVKLLLETDLDINFYDSESDEYMNDSIRSTTSADLRVVC